MSVKEFLGGVRVLQPSAENLRDPPPLWMFLTPSLTMLEHFCGHCGTLPRAKGPSLIIMDPKMDPIMDPARLIPGDPL